MPTRREFLKSTTVAGVGAGLGAGVAVASTGLKDETTDSARRPAGARYMGGFAAPAIDTVRIALIGVGARGSGHAEQLAQIEGTEIVAICDLYKDLAEQSAHTCKTLGHGHRHQSIGVFHGGDNEWRQMLEKVRPDAVLISTPWELHATMAIAGMRGGAHAFVEVPMAVTLDELAAIVDTSEATGKHCMMMENVNYGREELLYLNMCRQGIIGQLLHGEAAYIHELRFQMAQVERGTGSWRTPHYARRNGNLYPTHGLGPVAQYMNLSRGEDNFRLLVSLSSPAAGRRAHAGNNYPADHRWNQLDYVGGDINTSIVKTVLGRTVMVQWDETSPRPYTRHNLIQGTRGILAGFPGRATFDGGMDGVAESHHKWSREDAMAHLYSLYDHPLYKRLGQEATRMGGHGGMDFMLRYRIVECLRLGLPLDQNVYEGAFWSAVAPLSEASVAADGMPQAFPDFTRGDWRHTQPLQIVA